MKVPVQNEVSNITSLPSLCVCYASHITLGLGRLLRKPPLTAGFLFCIQHLVKVLDVHKFDTKLSLN